MLQACFAKVCIRSSQRREPPKDAQAGVFVATRQSSFLPVLRAPGQLPPRKGSGHSDNNHDQIKATVSCATAALDAMLEISLFPPLGTFCLKANPSSLATASSELGLLGGLVR